MNKKMLILFLALAVIIIGGYFFSTLKNENLNQEITINDNEKTNFLKGADLPSEDMLSASIAHKYKKNPSTNTAATSFSDNFSLNIKIEETWPMSVAGDKNWWVNSGAWFISSSDTGKTVQGDLDKTDRWYTLYLQNNPIDTDNGFHPQNIFRLVQRGQWTNFVQQVYFKINKINLSDSQNRNASNGLFLFNRYQSGDNLYYTGIRVDGAAVIKKKINGTYYTMAYKQIFPGAKYDRTINPNLLPLNSWLGLKSEVVTNSNNTVSVKLYTDIDKTGNWTLVLESIDDNSKYGGAAILNAGYAGIRTDFMDVEFSEYRISSN